MVSESVETRADAPSPEALVHLVLIGNTNAFEQLLDRFESRVFNYILRFVQNPEDAEELTQDTFVKAYRDLDRFDSKYSFSTWLFVIAKRTAISRFKTQCGHNKVFQTGPDHGEDKLLEIAHNDTPEMLLRDKESRESIWKTAAQLKPKLYETLWLFYGEGFSISEVAKIMDSSELNVRVMLHRARNQMFEMLEQKGWKTA